MSIGIFSAASDAICRFVCLVDAPGYEGMLDGGRHRTNGSEADLETKRHFDGGRESKPAYFLHVRDLSYADHSAVTGYVSW